MGISAGLEYAGQVTEWSYQHISPTLASLQWLPVCFHASFMAMISTYKTLNGLGPWDLKECLFPMGTAHPTHTFQAGHLRMSILREA